ncbi:hypothetical protein KEJ37_07505 [Candidatus Bathyarchaeota archaeon]|nr:hypothetical protein [Candidatus Bathyarchaeota archaeon]
MRGYKPASHIFNVSLSLAFSEEQPPNESLNYGVLKREHVRLTEEAICLTRLLQKTGEYDALTETAENLCLNTETLDNAKEVAAKLPQTWKGPKAPLHILITLMESLKRKTENN